MVDYWFVAKVVVPNPFRESEVWNPMIYKRLIIKSIREPVVPNLPRISSTASQTKTPRIAARRSERKTRPELYCNILTISDLKEFEKTSGET